MHQLYHLISGLTPSKDHAKMELLMTITKNPILEIAKQYTVLARNGKLNSLYCERNDGTHLPLISQSPDGEDVFLVCLSCDWRIQIGWRLADMMTKRIESLDN